MKSGVLLITLAMSPCLLAVTINDPYPGTVCGNASCDVIGDPTASGTFAGWSVGGAKYDVQNLSITSSVTGTTAAVTFDFLFNYNGDTTLGNHPDSANNAWMAPGDLLISSGGSTLYALALVDHSGANNTQASNGGVALTDTAETAGTLYANSGGGAITTRSAQEVLNNPANETYRFTQPVWAGGSLISVGSLVSRTVTAGTGPEVHVSITEDVDALGQFYFDLTQTPVTVAFTSATCGNDVLSGTFTGLQGEGFGTPEPFTFSLIGGGLLALAVIGRKKTRKQE